MYYTTTFTIAKDYVVVLIAGIKLYSKLIIAETTVTSMRLILVRLLFNSSVYQVLSGAVVTNSHTLPTKQWHFHYSERSEGGGMMEFRCRGGCLDVREDVWELL